MYKNKDSNLISSYISLQSEINKLLDAWVICSSHSSWSASIFEVTKGDGGNCLVIDYSPLNKVTWKLVWPMPRVKDIFSKLNGAKYFSTFTLPWVPSHTP